MSWIAPVLDIARHISQESKPKNKVCSVSFRQSLSTACSLQGEVVSRVQVSSFSLTALRHRRQSLKEGDDGRGSRLPEALG